MAHTSGIAIWSELDASIEVHINLWKVDKIREKDCHFLDIGVYLKDCNIHQHDVKIYFPFNIADDKVIDLYEKIVSEGAIYDIFNKPKLQVTTTAGESFARVSGYGEHESIITSVTTRIDDNNKNILKIVPVTFPEVGHIYFRIRINIGKSIEKYFMKRFRPKTSFLLPSFKEIEHISFSINEQRGMPLSPKLGVANSRLKITKIDFFLVRESEAVLLSQHSPFKRCRELEHSLWRSYLPDGSKNFDKKLAYHWQEKARDDGQIEHFGAFVKFSYSVDGLSVLFVYLMIVILIGALSGSVGNYISVIFSQNFIGMYTIYLMLITIILWIASRIKIKALLSSVCGKIKKCLD